MSIVQQIAFSVGTYAVQSLYQHATTTKSKGKHMKSSKKDSLMMNNVCKDITRFAVKEISNKFLQSDFLKTSTTEEYVDTSLLPVITDASYGEELLKKSKKIHQCKQVTLTAAMKFKKKVKKAEKQRRALDV